MKYLIVVLTLLLSACGSEQAEANNIVVKDAYSPPKMSAVWTGNYSSWWEIPQYYNGTPKYSGAFGTYTHKHIPVAVQTGGSLFSVRTDNTQDNNFYVYVTKDSQEVLVHTINNWDDPHTNAVINTLPYGYIQVRIASRGLAHKFQSGKVLQSKTPYVLDFECVEGCSESNINYEAYPQIHNTLWKNHLIYTHYETDAGDSRSHRRTWSKVNGKRVKLSNLSHYNVSYFDYHSEKLCVASNTLINSSPDNRVNLSVICTHDSFNAWTLHDNSYLDMSNKDESNRIVYNTESKGTFVYLKDIIATAGTFRVLFTESTSSDPTKGTRHLKEWVQGVGVSTITEVGHNYSAGAYLKKNGNLYIVAGKSNSTGYLSGDLELYDDSYSLIDTLQGDFSYVRRVVGTDGKAVMSSGASDYATRGKHYILTLQ